LYALSIENLNKSYKKKKALTEVSLNLAEGKICGLLGLNGAGKSTLMKILCGLSIKNSGVVKIMDKDISNIEYCNSVTGCMIESPAFYPSLTAYQNLQALAYLYNEKIERKQIEDVLNLVGLKEQKNLPVRKFSLGMKQRLHFAKALLNNPKLLILDEPFNGIDPIAVKLFKDIIKDKAKEGMAVLISSHVLPHLQQLCDEVYIIDKGKNTYHGKCDEDLEKMFFKYVTQDGLAQ
jgi:ABC-2 type transport system ATP-binding protein